MNRRTRSINSDMKTEDISPKVLNSARDVILESSKNKELFKIQIMKVSEVAEYLSLSESHIYKLVSRREIPHVKFRKSVRFVLSEIDNWIMNNHYC